MTDSVLNPSETPKVNKEVKNPKLTRNILMIVGAVALLGMGGLGVLAIAREKPELLGIKNQTPEKEADAQKELEALVKEIGQIIELPQGEAPTLATVTDLEQVKTQPFFAKAKNGDKVLVYAAAKKAILYRPSDKKIIEVGVVNMPAPTGEVAGEKLEEIQVITPTPLTENTPTVTVRQATETTSPSPTSTP